eukprot:PhM_4_TR11501/c0_g1_i1/m.97086
MKRVGRAALHLVLGMESPRRRPVMLRRPVLGSAVRRKRGGIRNIVLFCAEVPRGRLPSNKLEVARAELTGGDLDVLCLGRALVLRRQLFRRLRHTLIRTLARPTKFLRQVLRADDLAQRRGRLVRLAEHDLRLDTRIKPRLDQVEGHCDHRRAVDEVHLVQALGVDLLVAFRHCLQDRQRGLVQVPEPEPGTVTDHHDSIHVLRVIFEALVLHESTANLVAKYVCVQRWGVVILARLRDALEHLHHCVHVGEPSALDVHRVALLVCLVPRAAVARRHGSAVRVDLTRFACRALEHKVNVLLVEATDKVRRRGEECHAVETAARAELCNVFHHVKCLGHVPRARGEQLEEDDVAVFFGGGCVGCGERDRHARVCDCLVQGCHFLALLSGDRSKL